MNKQSVISPLRYPGSKQNLVDYFETFIKDNLLTGCHLHEVYAGGASISLAMLARELVEKATLVELDPLVYAFWRCVKSYPDNLYSLIEQTEVTVSTWKSFQKYRKPDALKRYPIQELGFAGLFFNRTNFSGIMGAGPIGGQEQASGYKINCRFNRLRIIESIKLIQPIAKRIIPVYGDAIKYLEKNGEKIIKSHSLVYIDPPYMQQGRKLYRHYYVEDQHRSLAQFMDKKQYPWIVSYDNHPIIESLFKNQTVVPISLNYAVKQSRRATELLISNQRLSEPVYTVAVKTIRKVAAM